MAGTVRMGLFVGNDVGFGTDEPLVYAEQEARDLARVFQDMGDLPAQRARVLQGASASQLRQAIAQTEAQVREASVQGHDVMLVFYYSGHASTEGLHLRGTVLPMGELRRWLETSSAQVRVAFVDACSSGALARSRGATAVDAVQVTVDDALVSSGLAIVSSTGPLSVARESDAFGGGVFSRALLTGLKGTADANGDGQITLEEAYQHAFAETVVSTASSGEAIQRPEYRFDMSGVGHVVLTRIRTHASGLILPEELEGTYTVVAVGTGQVVSRIEKRPGETRRLALSPGRYLVRKVRREDVLLAELDLVWGGDRWIDDGQMASVALGDPLARGGWNGRPVRLGVRGTASPSMLEGLPAMVGVELEPRVRIRPSLSVVGQIGTSRGHRFELSGRLRFAQHRLALGLGMERQLRSVDASVEAGPLLAQLRQRVNALDLDEEVVGTVVFEASQWVPGAWLQAGVHLPVGPALGLHASARTQAMRVDFDESRRFLVEGSVGLGLAVSLATKRLGRARRAKDLLE